MERTTSIEDAKKIMGRNFIGPEELSQISNNFPVNTLSDYSYIPYSIDYLINKKDDYLLIFGISKMNDFKPLNLLTLRELFGTNPDVSEPCFYNQDWYLKEDFMSLCLEDKWYLLKKSVFEESRAELPSNLEQIYCFPSAILCAYTFFVHWFYTNEILWKYDFVWCSDKDHNGDRIYIGKYVDIDGINKNGFSIHRHLALRNSYASITIC